MFTFGSLFAGVGGGDLGLEAAGMTCKWQVEIDDYATKVLEKRWPDVPKYRDVREVGKRNLARVNLIAGGFPCQDISEAGGREGIGAPRSGLWREFYRIICELRPQYVLVENSAALLGRGIARVLGDLSRSGYDAEWHIVSASAFGAPHPRNRCFIVAYPNSVGRIQTGHNERRIFSGPVPETSLWELSRAVCPPHGKKTLPAPFGIPDGVPREPHDNRRMTGLGNAQVPVVMEWIGRRILEVVQQ